MKNKLKVTLVYLSGFLFLLKLPSIKRFIGQYEFERELLHNEQLRRSDEHSQQEMKNRILENIEKRRIMLSRKTVTSFLFILLCSVLTISTYLLLDKPKDIARPLLERSSIYPFLSLYLFSFGTLGRLGWQETSWSGKTVYEIIDKTILWICYFGGMTFGVLSLLI